VAKSNFIVRGGADFSGIDKAAAKTEARLKSFQSGISSTMKRVGLALAAIGVGYFIKNTTQMAMGVESAVENISRNMGDSAKTFNNWAETQSKAFGLARSEAYKYGSTYSNLISGFTKNTAETEKYTTQLLKTSAIVASKTGRSVEDVSERIRSGLLGNTEAIEDVGIYAQVAMLKSTAAFKKIADGRTWEKLSYYEQQQVRIISTLEQAHNKYGDTLANTTATKQQLFIASLKNVQLNIGQAFLPIYNAVLPALTALANSLEWVTGTFAQFAQALFGKATMGTTAKETEQQATAMNDLGKSTEKAGKKAKGALASFDEINTLSLNKDSGGGSGGGSTASVAKPTTKDEGSKINPEIQKLAEKLKDIFNPITTAFENLKKSAEPLINTIGKYLKTFFDEVLVPFGSWVISDAIPAFLNLLGGALTLLNPIIKSFEPLVSWLFENFLKPLAAWTGNAFVTAINAVATALKSIGEWMNSNMTIVSAITTTIVAFMAAWKVTELLAFIQMSGGLISALGAIKTSIAACTVAKLADKAETIALTALYAKDLVVSLAKSSAGLVTNAAKWIAATAAMVANKVATIASTVAQGAMTVAMLAWNVACGIGTAVTTAFNIALAVLTSPITLVIAAIAALVAGVYLLIKHWDDVKQAASTAWSGIVTAWKVASGWFSTNVTQPVTNFFSGLWNGVKSGASTAWSKTAEAFRTAGNWFTTNVTSPIGTAFSTAWDGIKNGFSTAFGFIKTGIKNYINGYISVVEGFTNAFIRGINFIIKALNKINFNVPGWVPLIGGNSFGFNLGEVREVNLPRLKNGGITNGEMTAVIGDNPGGREVVSPLDDLKDIITGTINNAVNSGNNAPSTLVLQINDNVLGEVIIDTFKGLSRQTGLSVIPV
jgi:phage-related protein